MCVLICIYKIFMKIGMLETKDSTLKIKIFINNIFMKLKINIDVVNKNALD